MIARRLNGCLRDAYLLVGFVLPMGIGCASTSASNPGSSGPEESFSSFAGVWKSENGSRLNITTEGKVTGGVYTGNGPPGFSRFISIGGIQPAQLRRGMTADEAYFELRVIKVDLSQSPGGQHPDLSQAESVRVELQKVTTPAGCRLQARGRPGRIEGCVFALQQ